MDHKNILHAMDRDVHGAIMVIPSLASKLVGYGIKLQDLYVYQVPL